MEDLTILKNELIAKANRELKQYKFEFDEETPCWFVLAKKAKHEFMQCVVMELCTFYFTKEEYNMILAEENILDLCWSIWNDYEKTIPETIEFLVEYTMQDINDVLSKNGNHQSSEGN